MQESSNYSIYWLDDHADPLVQHRIERKHLRAVVDFLRIVPTLDQMITVSNTEMDSEQIYLIMDSLNLSARLICLQSLSRLHRVYIYRGSDPIEAFQSDQGHFQVSISHFSALS